jgi:hypothetical protein
MRNLAWRALLFALTATTAVIAADALLLKSKQASLNSYSDASVFDASESSAAADAAASVDESPAVAHATFSTANSSSSSSNSQLPRLIPLQLLLSPARFRLPQVRQFLLPKWMSPNVQMTGGLFHNSSRVLFRKVGK